MWKRIAVIQCFALVFLLALMPLGVSAQEGSTAVFINELHYDNVSTDAGEAIEIAGPAGTDLTGWTIVLYNGSGGAPYDTTPLSGSIPDLQDGYGVVGIDYPENGIQNGAPDGLALVDSGGGVVQFLSYEGTITAVGGAADGMTSTDIGVLEDGETLVGDSLQLSGTGLVYEDFAWNAPAANTLGAVNTGQVFTDAGPDYLPIYDIQETADPSGDSPYAGQEVTTEGVVTGGNSSSYFIQDPAGGPWSGLYVYDTSAPAVGDRVRLTGTISEYNNLTELGGLTEFTILSSGNALPAAELLPTGSVSQEQWEGVLMRVENVAVTELLDHAEWAVDDGSGVVVVDDKFGYDYEPQVGDQIISITGPLDYTFDFFKILPRSDADIELPQDYLPIHDIQFTEDPSGDSPYAGQTVTTEGVVTGSSYDGYLIQDPAGGPWTGIYVYDTSAPAVGDRVRLTGAVSEYYNLTELGSLSEFTILSSGNPLPAPAVLPTGSVSQEQWEGVLVRVENVTVTELLTYGEWVMDDGSGSVVADDKLGYDYEPQVGDLIASVTGPLDYTFNVFKILPRSDADIVIGLPDVLINELDADTPSYDELEFIELYDGGEGNVDLTGLALVLYNGSSDTVYDAFDLDGYSTNAEGYFVLGSVPEADFYVDPGSSGWLQNGADAAALYLGDAADFPDGAAVSLESLIDAIVYDTDDSDDAGLLVLLNADQPQVDETAGGDKDNQSNQRCPNGEGGPLNTSSYLQYPPTPGAENTCGIVVVDFGVCGDPAVFIHDVQGAGAASPLAGETGVILEGVVVGDFQDTSTQLRGFFLQEEDADADADPATSEGIFVYDYDFMDVNVGDVVRVLGSVTEYYDLTELNQVTEMAICSSGVSVTPAEITLPVPTLDAWEQAEGMLIHIPQTLVASDNYYLGRYGEIILAPETRLYQPTNVVLPGADAIALQELNLRSQIQVDDGSRMQNPLPLLPYIGPDNTLRAGDTIPALTGVLGYDYGEYEVHPTEPLTFERVNERQAAPAAVDGPVRVASFNVLNYFNGDGQGGGFPTSRGAETLDEFLRQRDKIISAIIALDADVVGLMEIENDATPYSAVEDLVSGLNEAAGATVYDLIDTGVVGTDEIRVALIYKPARVIPLGTFAVLDSSVDPAFIDTKNRPALAQSFRHVTGEVFTVAVNHLKSKGSDCNDIDDPDIGDGQGNCNLTRLAAAEALVTWLNSYPTGVYDPDILIIGDLNSYAMEDPIRAIEDAGYTNLISHYGGEWAYSYVYDGQAGYLDHALASASLTAKATGTTEWHINADEPAALDYNDYNQPDLYQPDPFRASDHDPVLVGFCDTVDPWVRVRVTPRTLWPPNHKYVTVHATVNVIDPTGGTTVTLLSVTSNQPDSSKWGDHTENDIVILDDYTFDLRAETLGWRTRIYTIKYEVVDGCGNSTVASARVIVRPSFKLHFR